MHCAIAMKHISPAKFTCESNMIILNSSVVLCFASLEIFNNFVLGQSPNILRMRYYPKSASLSITLI